MRSNVVKRMHRFPALLVVTALALLAAAPSSAAPPIAVSATIVQWHGNGEDQRQDGSRTEDLDAQSELHHRQVRRPLVPCEG